MKYNLNEHGFEVFENVLPQSFFEEITDEFLKNIEHSSNKEDVFLTEFGPKQIQHLEGVEFFKKFSDNLKRITNIEGDVLNMQIFIKYPDYKITSPHQDGAYFDDPQKK